MFAPFLVALWLISVVIALVWVLRISLRSTVAVCRLTNALYSDLMAAGVFRLRRGETTCA